MSQVAHSVSKVRANPSLTLEEKRAFHRDGYFIVRGAVSPDLVEAARRRIKAAQKGERRGLDRSGERLFDRADPA